MADRPILFSGPMVRALLDGRKTQTRRVLKPQPVGGPLRRTYVREFHGPVYALFGEHSSETIKLPYAPGDRLWVRESLKCGSNDQGAEWITYAADGEVPPGLGHYKWFWERNLLPSIHMPRWVSRLTLTVTDVRVQRVQDISEAGAIAEGVERDFETRSFWGVEGAGVGGATPRYTEARLAFHRLWDSLNAKRDGGAYSWDANPWVVAVTFTVAQHNIDAGVA